jgi:Tfp pilus assembly protein PilX
MRRALAREDGFTVIAAAAVLVVVALLVDASLALVLRRESTSVRDRSVARAVAAADAAADVAAWRMNRALVSTGSAGLLGLTGDVVRQLGCTAVSVGSFAVVRGTSGATWCDWTPWESLDAGASFRYRTSMDLTVVGAGASQTITRRVLADGRAGGRERRVLITLKLDLTSGNPTRLWKRWRYAACTAQATSSAPDSGCADPGT